MQRVQQQSIIDKGLPIILFLIGIALVVITFAGDRLGLRAIGAAFSTNQLFLILIGTGISLSGLLLQTRLRTVFEPVLLAVGAAAVVLAADLFVLTGFSEPLFRYALLLTFAVAFAIMHVAASVSAGQSLTDALRSLLKINPTGLGRFLGIVGQVALLVLVIHEFKLDNQVFYGSFIQLVFYGFILHELLPPEQRLRFFLFLSVATYAGVLGIGNALWVVAIVLAVIGILHLPVTFRIRTLLIFLVGGGLIVSRAGYLDTVPAIVWPILGSILMFRIIVYMYDLSHSKKPFDIWYSISYFLLLPNVLFPFFPVVDHSTYVRTYYNADKHEIYQVGARWIFRGVIQLILYRAIYYYFAIAPNGVTDASTLIQFSFTSFLLYMQVSGQFHLIIGILHLFGFNLPLSNDNYLLSSNFTDLWRRTNIYWKDFMQKVLYYPAYTWLTRRGIRTIPALVLTTVYVFAGTWFLHAWYWFWLRGSFLLTATDALFWVLLATLVIFNVLKESRVTRKRTLGKKQITLKEIISLGVSNAVTMSILTFLWSMWTSPTIGDWLNIWAIGFEPQNLGSLIVGYLLVIVVFILLNLLYRWVLPWIQARFEMKTFASQALFNGALVLVVFLAGNPGIYNRIGGKTAVLAADLTTSRLNDADANLLLRGYYENLISVSRFNTELWEVYSRRPNDWPALHETTAAQLIDTFELVELNPSISLNFHGAQFSTNEWGIRDQSYALVPGENDFRAVTLGPSFVMGSGVEDNEVFEWLLEDRLNEAFGGGVFEKYEILNFGVAGHSALQELFVFEFKALEFQPDALFYVSHQLEETLLIRNLANRFRVGSEIPYEFLNDIFREAGVDTTQSQDQIESLLKPFGAELILWTYERLVSLCEENGITPIWIYMPTLEFPDSPEDRDRFTNLAESAGFITVDISQIFVGMDIPSITVAEWDLHPNREGHVLIAASIYEAFIQNPRISEALGLEGP